MINVRKSPNMISTTGRSPVIAAPTPMPVKPGSDIGVSTTRSGPNSSTSPDNTLNGVPASATSSPRTQTRVSRRISSARASRTASANVNSRTGDSVSGIHVLFRLVDAGVGSRYGEFDGAIHFDFHFGVEPVQAGAIGVPHLRQRVRQPRDRIALAHPLLLLLLGAVVIALYVPDVVGAKTIRI